MKRGYLVVWSGRPMEWDEKAKTLYVTRRPTIFRSRPRASMAICKAQEYWVSRPGERMQTSDFTIYCVRAESGALKEKRG